MANRLSFAVTGLRELEAELRQMAADAPQVTARALHRWAEEVMTESKELCPVDTGTLRGTGHVNLPIILGSEVTVELGYGGPAAPYALAVHENPRSGQTGGISPSGRKYQHWARTGQWKYLETPLKRLALPPSVFQIFQEGLVTRRGLRLMELRANRTFAKRFAEGPAMESPGGQIVGA